MLKAKVNIQVPKVDKRLITLLKPFSRGKEIKNSEMSIFFNKNFGPYSKLRTANWPIAWRKKTQQYNNWCYENEQFTFYENDSEGNRKFLAEPRSL